MYPRPSEWCECCGELWLLFVPSWFPWREEVLRAGERDQRESRGQGENGFGEEHTQSGEAAFCRNVHFLRASARALVIPTERGAVSFG
jgi:hypothetical protein